MLDTTFRQNWVGWSKWCTSTGISDMMLMGSPAYCVGSNTALVENKVILQEGEKGAVTVSWRIKGSKGERETQTIR